MSSKPAPWTARGLELLADGEWHEWDRLVSEIAKLVPPGLAKRKAEWVRTRRAVRGGREPAPRAFAKSDEFLIRVGSRRLVYDRLVASTRIERRTDEDGRRWARLKGSNDDTPPAAT